MSGLYNMLMGQNPAFSIIMSAAGINNRNADQLGRIRDCWISEDAKTIGVLHRNYGEKGEEANDTAATLPLFRELQECGEDETYAYWIFDVPTEGSSGEILEKLAEMSDNTPCMDRYMEALKDFQEDKKTPQTAKMKEVGEKIIKQIKGSFDTGKSHSVETEDGGVDIITGGDL